MAILVGRVYGSIRPNLLTPLFDVQVLKIDETGLYIQGTEIESKDSQVSEHVQVWLCTPTDAQLSELQSREDRQRMSSEPIDQKS